MKYNDKLYGRIGRKYFDTGKTGLDWETIERELEEANAKLKFIYEECEAKYYFSSGDFDYVEIDEDCWDNIDWKERTENENI